jgi:polysaccharide biosynthesis transport protein
MLGRRGRPQVIAELPAPAQGKAASAALNAAALEMLTGLLGELGDARAVLSTGGEGKSALALGLATAAVAAGRHAVLVECDLAAPSLARRVGLEPAPGLHEYLGLKAEAWQILQPLVLAGPGSAAARTPLACVVGGRPTADGLALLDSEGFAHAIGKLRSAYELVVVDGPPLGDPSLLAVAPFADRTLAAAARADLPRKPPVRIDGVVLAA